MGAVRSLRQERAALARQMRAEGKTWSDVATAMADRYRVGRLTAMRLAHGMTQPEVAAEWCHRWPDEPKDDKALSCWERWPHSGHAPSLASLDRLAAIYACSVADLVDGYGDHRHLDANTRHGRVRPVIVVRRDDTLPGADEIAAPSRPVDDIASESTIADVAAIQAMSAAFQATDRKLGGGALYDSAARYLRAEVAPRLLTAIGGKAERHFVSAAASLTEAIGWMAHDAGDDRQARAYLGRAFRLASESANPALVGNVCASMSHLATQLDQPTDAVRIAARGLDELRESADVAHLVARLHAMRARGLAHQREGRDCLVALDAAEKALGRGNPQAVDWVSPFDEASLASEAAICLRMIGDLTAAEQSARHAIDLRRDDRIRSRALAQLTLAEVLVDAARIEEAAITGQLVTAVTGSLASTQVQRRLDGLASLLGRYGSLPVVATFLTSLTTTRDRPATSEQSDDAWPT